MPHESWCEFGKNWKNILEKRFIRVLGITLVLHFAKVITDRIWLMNWDWTKVGKGLVLIRWKLIQNDWLVVVFVCLFMSAPGASLTHFTFIFFLKVIVLSTRFYCRIVSGKSAWKPSGADLQIPPNWREKPLFYLFEKSSKPTTTNQTTQTGYQPYVPEYSLAPVESSREIRNRKFRWNFTSGLNSRPEVPPVK